MKENTTGRLKLPVSARDHIRGAVDAPVTLLEYGDFECPYCGQAHIVIETLRRRVGPDLRFVFRHFPLAQVHPHAADAAEAAETAGEQGRFWEMHDLLYANQLGLNPRHLLAHATTLGLDTAAFKQAMSTHRYAVRVREDFVSGMRSGVNGTPSLFINELRYDGPRDLDSLFAAINVARAAARGERAEI